MKKIYSQCFAVFCFFLILFIGTNEGNAQVIKPFKERTSLFSPARTIYKIKGDFTMIGNSNLTLQHYSDTEPNGTNPMVYVDRDNNNQTHNSSGATLDLLNDSGAKLTNCYSIVYAGLYWTGRVSDAANSPDSFTVRKNGVTKTLDKRKILFKGPVSSNYTEFTASDIYFPTNADNNMFSAYAEVTDYVRTNGVGEYFAANIAATEGADGGTIGKYAGWGLVVIYENSNMKNRDITVFDGHAFVTNNTTANYTIPVSGFNSVTSGPVGIKLGIMAGEGDLYYDGDYFQIQKLNTNTYQSLSHSLNTATNFFNSTINTGGNNRNPNLMNNSGIDITMFNLPNSAKDLIGNNQTSTTFKYGSTVDTYAIFSIVMAVDAYVPEIEGILTATTINGNNVGAGPYTVLPGQELGYKVQIKNKGSEAIQNSKIVIPIPYNATFVGNSLAKTVNFSPAPTPNSLTYEPTIGANGSIVWDIGTLPLPSNPDTVLAELTFKLKATENCALLKNSNCNNNIQVNGVLSGKGANSGVTVADKSLILGYTNSGSCTGTSIAAPLQTSINSTDYTNANCQATPPIIAFTFCNTSTTSIPVTDVIGSFPTGSTFYNAYPVVAGTTTQYTINNPFPATVGTKTYYAIPPGGASSGCYFQFTITIESITTMPTVAGPVNYCIGDNAVPLTAVASKPEYTLYYYQTTTSTAQQSITPLTTTAGQFTFYVAEGKTNACIGPKKEIVVNVNAKPTVVITNPLPICAPATSLDLTAATITAGSTTGLTYTYWTDATATTPLTNFSAAIPGTYYIKGTNASNCYDIKPVTVTKSTVTVTEITASHVDVKCFNGSTGSISINNASGGVGPYTYSWKKNGAAYTGTSQTLTNLGFGNYEVTATDANGCAGTLIISVLQPAAALALGNSSKTDISCYGTSTGTITAGTVTNAVGTVSYSWKNSANVEVGTTATIANLPAGTYTLTVTDSCSSQSNSVTIEQPTAALALGNSSKTDISCYGTSTGSVTAGTVTNAVGTVNYSWKNIANVEVGTAATVANLPAGTYTLTVTDSCSSQSNSVTIAQPTAALTLGNSSKTDISCYGANTGSVTAGTVTNAVGTVNYSWKNSANVEVGITATVANLPAGTYTLTVTDSCSSQSNSVIIIQPTTALSCSIIQNKAVSANGLSNGEATVTPIGGNGDYTYLWDNNETTQKAISLSAGTHSVTVTDSKGCTTTCTVTITEPNVLSCSISQDSPVKCFGENTGKATITAVGGNGDYTYLWDNGETTAQAITLSAGLHTVTVTDKLNYTTTCTVTISQPQSALSATKTQTDVTCGGGNNGSATVTVSGGTAGYTYSWNTTPVQTTATATTLASGNYTVLITDANGCNISESFTILDGDAVIPVINPLPEVTTINCPAEPVFTQATATDNNGTIASLTYVDTITPGNCAGSYTKTRTWTAKDSCGNTSLPVSQTIIVQDITAPTWTTLAGSLDKTIECSDAAALANAQTLFPTASDSCDADVTNIVKVSGQFVASTTCANAGTYTNTWTVKDDCGNTSDTFMQVITIQDTTAPAWTTLAGSLNKTIECSDTAALANAQALFPTASDSCDADVTNIVKVSGQFMASATCSNAGTYTNTWTVKDDCGNTSDTFTQVITIQDTTAPAWTTLAGSLDKTIECSDATALVNAQALFPTASDSCDADVTNIIKVSGQFVASATCANAGTYTNTWTVKDDCGNTSDTFTQVITIQDTTAPTWTTLVGSLDKTIECSDAAALANAQALFPTASDSCDADVTNIVKVSGQFVASATCANAGTYTNTWTVKDDCGNTSDTFTQVITIQDTTAPTWTTLAGSLNKTIECSDAAALANAQALFPTASDSCDADVTNIVKVSGQFVASATCANAGTYTNTWTVKDDCGNTSDTFTQVINIQDTTAPTFTGALPQDVTVSCDAIPQAAEMTASDNCNGDLPIVFTETKSNIQNGCPTNYILTRTWKTSDCGGNTASYTQIITVRDTTPPTGTAPANLINLASADLIPVGSSSDIKDAADNCSPTVNITVSDATGACDGNVYILTRTYTLTDCAGNKTELVQTFSVNCKVKKKIIANDDNAGPIAGVNHTTVNVLNIFSNDTLEGNLVTPSDVILTTVTPNNYLQLNPDGSVDVLPNAPVGTLTLVYQICEAAQPDNCDTAIVTITIEAPKMTVTATAICVNDVPYVDYVVTPLNFTPVNGVSITWSDSNNNAITTTSDLPLSGRILWPGAIVDVNGKGIDWPGWIFENNKWVQGVDGFEKLRPKANLIISLNPSETIIVDYPPSDPYCTARPTFAIIANDDTAGPVNGVTGANNVINVLTNDTLNGTAVNINDVTLTTTIPDPKGAITLNSDGSVNVAPNTPAGTYTLTYQICEKADFGNCDTAIVTVTVTTPSAPPTPVVANDDSYSNIGCNTFGLVGNVLANDVKGTTPVTLEMVNFTLTSQTNPNITIDGLGNVTVSSLTPAGTYTYNYRICDKLSSENCDTATVTITVVPNGVTNIKSTACTDDSSLINLTTLLPEGSPITGTWVDKTNSNALQGSVFNPFGLALGNYTFEYLIADEKCPRSIVLDMEVNDDCKVLACGEVFPHNAFSPNGDNFNETFKIDNIDDVTCYPENTVEIYNRWGILVFETKNYNNTTNAFDGISRGRTTVKQSDGLPTGTYFYIINYKSLDGSNNLQDNKLSGYLYLSK
ncbi:MULTISPECIES: gliding motility-associated C-terminal domain-containing protein [Flavobacterium]|uniref:HYR-like domain-containing protein n=1 Tax=Flavobacterium TaxID=237 RepID=UPI001183179F|nr:MULTISPECIES: gliding motility-associated C-terminal domain-containing protein [Flavobacterium]MCR4031324.1 gliding motility-associated C-terminal domain-containing protein [Flavobacterium panacis]